MIVNATHGLNFFPFLSTIELRLTSKHENGTSYTSDSIDFIFANMDGYFILTDSTGSSYTINVNQGWNLLSWNSVYGIGDLEILYNMGFRWYYTGSY